MRRATRVGDVLRYVCPVDLTLDMIGRKWQPLILCALYAGPLNYNTLQAALASVTHKVLTQQLRSLERNGIIERQQRGGQGTRRVEYALTRFGRTLKPVLYEMARWANTHHHAMGVVLEMPRGIKKRLAAIA
jgi:DNA-binding HxlR family transcriptional regulator